MLSLDGLPYRIRSKIVVSQETGCWLWQAWVSEKGYGYVYFCGRNLPAHRVVYELLIGTIPPGLTIDHQCDSKHCVNPENVQLCTASQNRKRAASVPFEEKLVAAQHLYDMGHTKTDITYELGISGRFLKSLTKKEI